MRVRAVLNGNESEWSGEVEFMAPEFAGCCIWKDCPKYADEERRYSVDEKNPRIATKIDNNLECCTIIGNTPLPLNKATSWNIKTLKSNNNGYGIYVGVAPSDINQNEDYNHKKCGWYFSCYDSTLCSGPPHDYGYKWKEYGPRKRK